MPTSKPKPRLPYELGRAQVAAGTDAVVHLPVSVLPDHTPVNLSVHVFHGKQEGPTLFVSAAVHGDEVIGVEIVRRLLHSPVLKRMRGTLLAVPIVNTFGFMNHSRYLPDRRDLNRSFPGSPTGSLASRLAHIFLNEVVLRADFGIDLHSAAIHRTNLPQIRVTSSRKGAAKLAERFGAPITLHAKLREGSLRGVAAENGVDMLLYEAGEGLRFDEYAVKVGVAGCLNVMREMGMLPPRKGKKVARPLQCSSSSWLRSPAGGLLRAYRGTGDMVTAGELLGQIADPFGSSEHDVVARHAGLVIGRTNLPIVNEGDGLFHVAEIDDERSDDWELDDSAPHLEQGVLADEDEII